MDSFDFNFCHALSLFAATSKAGEAFETCEFLLTHSKGHRPELNLAVFKQPHYKLSRAIERSLAYYARLRLPFRVHLAVDETAVNTEFETHGFVRAPDLPFMLLTKDPSLAPAVGLTVRSVKDATTLGDFQRIAFESFGYPVQHAPVALTDELAKLAHVELFVGYVNDVACCCSALIISADVAGIYWVGTLAAQRGQGLGAAITAHAAKVGLAHGKQVCLQATEIGAPVYRRLGFIEPRAYVRFDHV